MAESDTQGAFRPGRRYLPSKMVTRGKELLHQQCWLWGQDIKRPAGNLLLAYGFERVRPPEGISGSSQYTLEVSGGSHLRLWGFGVYFGGATGIYINRYEFVPRETSLRDLWRAQEMERLPRSRDFALLPGALRAIASYESWVTSVHGPAYRARCLQGWQERASGGSSIAADWLELARSLEAHLAKSPSLFAGGAPAKTSLIESSVS